MSPRCRPPLTRPPLLPRATAALLAGLTLVAPTEARSLAEWLTERGDTLGRPEQRQQTLGELRRLSRERRRQARRRALRAGLPLRRESPDGTVRELVGFQRDEPLYLITHNATASISTDATAVRDQFSLDGSGVTIGLWDSGSGRAAHQEFSGRLTVLDGSSSTAHATHVAGTLAAAGMRASARGMAPAATIDSYNWSDDIAEMAARGAATPDQPGAIQLSNHSYGYVCGWTQVNEATHQWVWWGAGTNAESADADFGRYDYIAAEIDALAAAAPYYLIVRSAGNDRADNPAAGDLVALDSDASEIAPYDPALHPPGDNTHRGGYDTISYAALAKNVLTVGSVSDAASSGLRDLSRATISSFSAWGPTDDGRIKPDLVANGESLHSSLNGGNTSYGNYSGTSMAAPNATGSAALVLARHRALFPGQTPLSSTLKGLLIHTADDLGNPGPDYRHGWGLVDTLAAVELLTAHQQQPLAGRLRESQLSTVVTSESHDFVWDGSSPIRATLCWTDPAGAWTYSADSRSSRLVHDLDLKLVAPDGSEHFPFVMPFVGDWSQSAMNAPATTGVNHTDNVEQIVLPAPATPGIWRVVVSTDQALAAGGQAYSLFLDGPSPILPATVTLGDLLHDFDGQPKAATATTDPAGLAVQLTYDGSSDPPSAVGSYAVVATVTEAGYQGQADGQLEILGTLYNGWRDLAFSVEQISSGAADPDEDLDGDGLRNFAEYALGGDPSSYTAPPSRRVEDGRLVLEFSHPIDRSEVTGYFAESSLDFENWSDVPLTIVAETATHRSCRAEVELPDGDAQVFLRLRIER